MEFIRHVALVPTGVELTFPAALATPTPVAFELLHAGFRNEPAVRVALRGTGSCLPARVVPNDEFTDALNLDTTDEWIRTRTGIRERRFADLGETSASLGTIASRRAIESAGLAAEEIDLIV